MLPQPTFPARESATQDQDEDYRRSTHAVCPICHYDHDLGPQALHPILRTMPIVLECLADCHPSDAPHVLVVIRHTCGHLDVRATTWSAWSNPAISQHAYAAMKRPCVPCLM